MRTSELVSAALGLSDDFYSIAFQSRLGRDRWLTPNTMDAIEQLARSGVKNLLVACPSFVTDCLETLEEIGIRGRKTFEAAGGNKLELVPCLNDRPSWVRALGEWCA